ncbi:hypothetical protein F0A16_20705, partial [Salinicola corii]
MGAFEHVTGRKGGGKSGGGSGRVAQEDPNTLRSNSVARIIDLLGEGPIEGLVDGAKSIFFDETPLRADDGSWNFSGVNYDTRAGLPDQDHVAGFPSVENETEVSAQVTQDTPLVRTINDADTDAVRVTVQVPALTEQDKETGDLHGSSVQIAIDVRPSGGSWSTRKTDTIKGKSTSPYQRGYRVELEGAAPWDIRVRRISADNDDDSAIRNETYWSSYTAIVDGKFIYPDSALIALEVDAQQFGNSIPSRAYHVRGRLVSVPDNYDPATRTYTGIWSGAFQQAWTDNPAWIFYDLAINVRFGGQLENVDKWALYEIGRYCDELVPNGYGADEPRFTINTVINSREDAYKVLTTLAAAFRGMMYWGTGTVTVVQDSPAADESGRIFSQADTQDGEFRYSGSSLKSRHTVAMVMWNDPADNYRQTPEVVEDPAGIQQYGWRQTDVTAFGCTSRGQARRVGLWLLYTEREETETVEFTLGLEHADIRPGEVVKISDRYKAGARLGGRLTAVGSEAVTLDKRPDVASGSGWKLSVQMPNGSIETRDVAGFDDDQVTLAAALSTEPMPYAMWMLASEDIQPPRFRVVGVKEDSDDLTYTVTALKHNPNKFALIEQGLVLPETPTSLVPIGRLSPPQDINVESYTYLSGGAQHQGLLISWVKSGDPRTQYYIVNVLPPGENVWQDVGSTDQTSLEYRNAPSGEYQIRVRAVDGAGRLSAWSVRVTTISSLLQPLPPTTVDVETANRSVTLIPRSDRSGQLYEYRRATTPLEGDDEIEANAVDLGQATQLADTNLQPGTQYYYWVRGVNAYGVSSWYPVQAKTREEFESEWAYIDEQLRKDGGLVDQLENGINDNSQLIGQAREDFEDGLAEANAGIERTDALIGEIGTEVDQLTSNVDTELAGVNQRIGAANDRIDGIETDQAAAEEALGNLDTEIDQLSSDVETEFSGVNDQIADANQRIDGVESIAEGADTKADILAEDVSTLDSRADGHDAEISETNRIARLNGMLEAFERQAAQVQTAAGSAAYTVERIQRISQGQSLSQATEELDARLSGNIATARSQITTLVDTTQSITDSLTELRSEYEGTSAEFDSRITAVTTQAQAIADYVLNLESEVEDGFATVQSRITTVANESEALSRDIRTLRSEYEGFSAEADQRLTTLANDQQAMTQSLQALSASYDASTADFDERITTLADEQKATAQSLSQLSTAYGETTSDFEQRISALSSATEGLVEETSRLSTQLGNAEAAIENVRRVQRFDGLLSAFERQVSQVQTAAGSAAYTVERIQRISQGESLSQQTEEVRAELSGNLATARSQITALVNTTQSITDQLTGLRSEYDDTSTEFDDRITLLASEAESIGNRLTALTSETDQSLADVRSTLSTLSDDTQALGQSLNTLRAEYEGFSAEADQRLTVLANDQQSMSQSLSQLSASYDASTADFDERITTLADEQKATAQSLSQLSTAYGETTSDFEQRITALSSATEGLVEEVSSLSTQLGDAEAVIENVRRVQRFDGLLTAFQSSATQVQTSAGGAAIRFDRLVSVSEQQALARQTEEVKTELGQTTSSLRSELSSLSSEQQALAQDLLDLNAELGDTSASLHSELAALSDGVNAVSQRQDEYRVEVDDQFASVEDNISAVYDPDTGAVAQAITTVNVNGKTGMLGLQAFGEEIQIVGVADEFAILNPISGELVTAFVVSDGRVIIPEALIDSLVVTKLRSTNGNLVFDGNKLKADYIDAVNLKVKWANVQDIVIQWADIQGVKIQTADIEDAAVTTLKIAGQAVTLPQSNYQEGNRYFKRSNTGSSG